MRVLLLIALMLLPASVPPQFSAESTPLTGITSPPTFPTFTLPADSDRWVEHHDLTTCELVMQRLMYVESEVYLLTYQQPTLPQCSDTWLLNWVVVRDRLAAWLNASATDATGYLTSGLNVPPTATSSLTYGFRYVPSEGLSWTIQGLLQGSQESTQTMLLYSPSGDWYMRFFLSGGSLGDGELSTMQQVEVGYQGHSGPQLSVTLGRQFIGIAELDSTIFVLGASFHDLSVKFNYTVATASVASGEFSAVRTLDYPSLSLTFPINGWSWTVSGIMGEAGHVEVAFSRENANLSGNLSLVPLGFWLTYGAEL